MRRRLRGLQTGNPFNLRIVFESEVPDEESFQVEQVAHGIMGTPTIHGGEWFKTKWELAARAVTAAAKQVGTNRGTGIDGLGFAGSQK